MRNAICANAQLWVRVSVGLSLGSGVAKRVPCARGQEIFLRPQPTKTTEFEKKNRRKMRKRLEQNLFCIVILFFFDSNKMHLAQETDWTKL